MDLLTKQIESLEGTIRQQSPRYAALTRPEPLTLSQVQRELLDPDCLVLRFALGDDRSYLWTITTNDFSSYTLPKRAEIESRVVSLRRLMTARVPMPGESPAAYRSRVLHADGQYMKAASDLSRMLLGPLADRLDKQRLLIVADGALQYLPFASLPSPGTLAPLVVDHEIVSLPSVSVLSVLREEAKRRRPPDRLVAIFADPVFQKQTTSAVAATSLPAVASSLLRGDTAAFAASLPRLPATRLEAESILSLAPEGLRMAALGFSATKAAAMDPGLTRYRIVHFATHTLLFDERPDLSSLVLSLVNEQGQPQDGLLRLREVYNLKLSAELVVLSACDTAIGREIKGEGLMSMVRGFMYSGTPRVLATLWKVDDDATQALMKEFYTQLLQQRRSPAAALRQAQIALMRKQSTQAPYYWAPFQLNGEWR
jgi:CHAT domain-containing protein